MHRTVARARFAVRHVKNLATSVTSEHFWKMRSAVVVVVVAVVVVAVAVVVVVGVVVVVVVVVAQW